MISLYYYSCTAQCTAVMPMMTASEPHPLPQHALIALLLLLLLLLLIFVYN